MNRALAEHEQRPATFEVTEVAPDQLSFLERILNQSESADSRIQLFISELGNDLTDILLSPEMLPHLRIAADQLQTELETLLAAELIDFDEMGRLIKKLRETTYAAAMEGATQEQSKEQRIQEILSSVEEALRDRKELSDPIRRRIMASCNTIAQGIDVSSGETLRFVGYGATKDVFCLERPETNEKRAIAMVHVEEGVHTAADIVKEVQLSQEVAIPGIIEYTTCTFYDRNGAETAHPEMGVQARIESAYIDGEDTPYAIKSLYHELQKKSFEDAVKEQMLSAYRDEIDTKYKEVQDSLEQKYAIVTEDTVFSAMIEQYADQFESIINIPKEEIIKRLQGEITKTIEKQRELLSSEEHATEADIGKNLLVRAIATKQLSIDVKQRADRLRIKEFTQIVTQFEKAAQAIDALHRTGYIHQDIKPENIIGLQLDPSDYRNSDVTVIDLGITTTVGDIHTLQKGTKRYMEPEVFGPSVTTIIESGGVQQRKDVRAFAITLFDAMSDAFGMERLTVFPPVVDTNTGAVQAGEDMLSKNTIFARYYEGDMDQKYAFLQTFLQHHFDMPQELLAIFDKHPALDGGGPWEATCQDVFHAFHTWVSSRTVQDMAHIQRGFAYLANPDSFIRAYTNYQEKNK